MTDLDREDRQKIADAADKLVAVSALRRIHGLITLEAIGNAKAKRLAGTLGGTVFGLFFLALFLRAFHNGIENRHPSPRASSKFFRCSCRARSWRSSRFHSRCSF